MKNMFLTHCWGLLGLFRGYMYVRSLAKIPQAKEQVDIPQDLKELHDFGFSPSFRSFFGD